MADTVGRAVSYSAQESRTAFQEKRIMSGTWGQVWLGDSEVGEAYGIQAKINFKKEDVPMCGRMGMGKKVTGYDGTGSLKLRKVNSRMGKLIGEDIRNGKDVRFTIISKLADPDAAGTERISLTDVSFDDLTLADWEAGRIVDVEVPFTFGDYSYLEKI